MTTYSDVFGGANIYPSEISYSSISLVADMTLNWPTEASASSDFATRIIDVSASTTGLTITLPSALAAGVGETILFNNVGANSFRVDDAGSTQVISAATGTVWQTYLSNNSTTAGVWKTFQYGASISSANASALAGAGLIAIGARLSQDAPVSEISSNYTLSLGDRAYTFLWTGTGTGTVTLPAPSSVGDGWFINIINQGDGALSLAAAGLVEIDGLSSKSYQPGESSMVVTDGTNFYSLGFGQPADFAFDYTSIAVPGSGNYTLSGAELNRIVYNFTGILTGDRSIIVPNTVQQYWVDNGTTGAYTLTVKTSAGSGIVLAAGGRTIMYCDGTNVIDADTGGISLPVSIAQGGTGAISASSARVNLGGTSVGISIFTAVDEAAVLALLGPISGGSF